jgi:hypothetical protein
MAIPLQKVVKIVFSADLFPDTEDMSRHHLGVQFNEIAPGMPKVACVAQQVVDLEGLIRVKSQFGERQIHPAGVGVMRIQIHHSQNDIGKIRSVFTIANQLLGINRVKAQATIAVKRGVVEADAINASDDVLETV